MRSAPQLVRDSEDGRFVAYCKTHAPDADFTDFDAEFPLEAAKAKAARHDELLRTAIRAGSRESPIDPRPTRTPPPFAHTSGLAVAVCGAHVTQLT